MIQRAVFRKTPGPPSKLWWLMVVSLQAPEAAAAGVSPMTPGNSVEKTQWVFSWSVFSRLSIPFSHQQVGRAFTYLYIIFVRYCKLAVGDTSTCRVGTPVPSRLKCPSPQTSLTLPQHMACENSASSSPSPGTMDKRMTTQRCAFQN